MTDQANELRKLVLRSTRENAAQNGPAPRLVALTGGKGGVGTSTLAAQLSIALIEQGARVVLIDADLHRADIATLCGLAEQRSVADVLASRSDIHEVLMRGPAGVLVVPGVWAPGSHSEYSEKAQLRLLKQIHLLGRHADIVVLDAGSGSNDVVRRFWQAANDVVLVTSPDSVAVMDSYATIKTVLAGETETSIQLIVNQAASPEIADDVHRRIDQSCRRFLGTSIGLLGNVPVDETVRSPAQNVGTFRSGDASPGLLAISLIAAKLMADTFVPDKGLISGTRAA